MNYTVWSEVIPCPQCGHDNISICALRSDPPKRRAPRLGASVDVTNGTSLRVSSSGHLSEHPTFRLLGALLQFAASLKLVLFVRPTEARLVLAPAAPASPGAVRLGVQVDVHHDRRNLQGRPPHREAVRRHRWCDTSGSNSASRPGWACVSTTYLGQLIWPSSTGPCGLIVRRPAGIPQARLYLLNRQR